MFLHFLNVFCLDSFYFSFQFQVVFFQRNIFLVKYKYLILFNYSYLQYNCASTLQYSYTLQYMYIMMSVSYESYPDIWDTCNIWELILMPEVTLILYSFLKNPAYGRQRISRRMRLVAPILGWTENTKKNNLFEKRKKSSKIRKLKNV